MTIAVQRAGLVMVLKTVKIRLLAVISPVMTMMVVTAQTVEIFHVVMVHVTVGKPKQTVRKIALHLKAVQTVNLISQLTDLNAPIQPGMSLVLTV